MISAAGITGALAGNQAGKQARRAQQSEQNRVAIEVQYALGEEDIAAGRYDIAYQRLEWVLEQDPAYPGAKERMLEIIQILHVTATPRATATATPLPSPTPTRDLRPVQDLLAQIETYAQDQAWSQVIDAANNLRGIDPDFEVTRVDNLLFLALRSRGVDRILRDNDLEGGTYDLALAERFGPLDVQADNARGWARIYLYGSSFWEAVPAQAVYYFGQVASAAPYLRDASGWTSIDRYHASLIHYGDQLAASDKWCEAEAQYALALGIRASTGLPEKVTEAAHQCATPTPTITPTFEATETLEPTETPAPPTATASSEPSATPTPETVVPTTEAPSPSETQPLDTSTPSPPTLTPSPTLEPTTAVPDATQSSNGGEPTPTTPVPPDSEQGSP